VSKPSAIYERDLQQAVRRLFHNHQYILVNSFVFNWESDLFSVTKSGNVYEVEMKISKADYRKDFEKEKHQLFKSNTEGKTHHIFHRPGHRWAWDQARVIGRHSYQEVTWQHPEGYYYDYKLGTHVTGYGESFIRQKQVELMAPCTAITIKPITDILCPNRFYYACPPGIISVADLPSYAGLIHVEDSDAQIIKQAPFVHKRPMLGGKITRILLDKFWYLSQNQRYHLAANNIDFKDCGDKNATNNRIIE
jgi:hypothetical protein